MFRDVEGHEKHLETDGTDVFRKEYIKVTKLGNEFLQKRRKLSTRKKSTLTYCVNYININVNINYALGKRLVKTEKNKHYIIFAPKMITEVAERFNIDTKLLRTLESWEIEFYAESIGVTKNELTVEIFEYFKEMEVTK